MRRTPDRERTIGNAVIVGELIVVLAVGAACTSGDSTNSPTNATASTPSGSIATTTSPTGTPNTSPSLSPADARSARAIALDWSQSISGLPRPDVVQYAPATSGTVPDLALVAVWLKFPGQVTLPPGIRMIKVRGEREPAPPLGDDVYTTDTPWYGTTVMVFVDLAGRRVHAVSYVGLSRQP